MLRSSLRMFVCLFGMPSFLSSQITTSKNNDSNCGRGAPGAGVSMCVV